MSLLYSIWAVIAAAITIIGLIITFARVSPDEAKKNLTHWASFFRLPRLAHWFKHSGPQAFIRIGALLLGIGTASLSNVATKFISDGPDRSKLEQNALEIKALQEENAALRSRAPTSSVKTGYLNMDDTDRWKFAGTLNAGTANNGSGKPCEARLFGKPNDHTAQAIGNEFPKLLQLGSWHVEGGRNPKSVFPDGITINTGQDKGVGYTCGYRLSEILENSKIRPVSFRVNIASPDLVECKECVEIVFGTTKVPE